MKTKDLRTNTQAKRETPQPRNPKAQKERVMNPQWPQEEDPQQGASPKTGSQQVTNQKQEDLTTVNPKTESQETANQKQEDQRKANRRKENQTKASPRTETHTADPAAKRAVGKERVKAASKGRIP